MSISSSLASETAKFQICFTLFYWKREIRVSNFIEKTDFDNKNYYGSMI